jgi:uncharacterized protein YutE (UPF0331/DUF86 family)
MMEEIASKLEMLRKYVGILRSYQKHGIEDLEEDVTLRGAVERYLGVALECALDIGEMIISAERLEKPESYRRVIEILGKEGILPEEFSEKFAPAAGFRNILVHAYADVDIEKLYEFLQNDLEDFDEFSRHIARHLEERLSSGEELA